jgi:hypothetical protein
MTIQITKKITGYSVLRPQDAAPADAAKPADTSSVSAEREKAKVIQMHEKLERPDTLRGTTYKIKTPLTEHALYVTVNDIVLNPGTEHEHYRPFEIFINSKNMEHFQWIVALTRIVSAVFRKGGDITFLVEELKAVFDPRGGYFKKGGRYMPSLVAEIGDVIEQHLRYIGMLPDSELDARQLKLIEEKRSEFEARTGQQNTGNDATYPDGAQLCYKCSTKAMIMMDGCLTCLNCGESKCG